MSILIMPMCTLDPVVTIYRLICGSLTVCADAACALTHCGHAYAGDKMLESEAVRKIGFTGSTAVGKTLMAGAAQTVKKVSLELGGNAPYIIFDDADIELAATGVVTSAFRNAGQTCICANKILVQVSPSPEKIYRMRSHRKKT